MSDTERLDQLIQKYIDRLASDAELAELNQRMVADPQSADLFARSTRTDSLLATYHIEEAAANAERRRADPTWEAREAAIQRRTFARRAFISAGVAAAAVVAAVLLFKGTETPPPTVIATLTRTTGNVELRRSGKRLSTPPPVDLLESDEITVPVSGTAVVVYEDGTRLDLDSRSTVAVSTRMGGGKNISLSKGSLTADVAHQPQRKPLLIETPHATATVLGTTLTLAADRGSTRLVVKSGKVAIARMFDGKSVAIQTGEFTDVAESGGLSVKSLVPWLDLCSRDEVISRLEAARRNAADAKRMLADGKLTVRMLHVDANAYGHRPLNPRRVDAPRAIEGSYDWGSLNEDYFKHVDFIVEEARQRKVKIVLGGIGLSSLDFLHDKADIAALRTSGEWLGERYPHTTATWSSTFADIPPSSHVDGDPQTIISSLDDGFNSGRNSKKSDLLTK